MRNVLVDGTDREKLEFSLVHRLREDLQVGIEYGADSDELFPMLNYRLIEATDEHPAVVVGTSSAWPSGEGDGNAYFVSVAQMLSPDLSGSLSLSFTPDDSSWRVPAYLAYGIKPDLEASLMWDGDDLHPLVTYRTERVSFSFILLGGEDPAISTSFGF